MANGDYMRLRQRFLRGLVCCIIFITLDNCVLLYLQLSRQVALHGACSDDVVIVNTWITVLSVSIIALNCFCEAAQSQSGECLSCDAHKIQHELELSWDVLDDSTERKLAALEEENAEKDRIIDSLKAHEQALQDAVDSYGEKHTIAQADLFQRITTLLEHVRGLETTTTIQKPLGAREEPNEEEDPGATGLEFHVQTLEDTVLGEVVNPRPVTQATLLLRINALLQRFHELKASIATAEQRITSLQIEDQVKGARLAAQFHCQSTPDMSCECCSAWAVQYTRALRGHFRRAPYVPVFARLASGASGFHVKANRLLVGGRLYIFDHVVECRRKPHLQDTALHQIFAEAVNYRKRACFIGVGPPRGDWIHAGLLGESSCVDKTLDRIFQTKKILGKPVLVVGMVNGPEKAEERLHLPLSGLADVTEEFDASDTARIAPKYKIRTLEAARELLGRLQSKLRDLHQESGARHIRIQVLLPREPWEPAGPLFAALTALALTTTDGTIPADCVQMVKDSSLRRSSKVNGSTLPDWIREGLVKKPDRRSMQYAAYVVHIDPHDEINNIYAMLEQAASICEG